MAKSKDILLIIFLIEWIFVGGVAIAVGSHILQQGPAVGVLPDPSQQNQQSANPEQQNVPNQYQTQPGTNSQVQSQQMQQAEPQQMVQQDQSVQQQQQQPQPQPQVATPAPTESPEYGPQQ